MKAKKIIIKNLIIAFMGVSAFFINVTATAANGELNKDTGIHIIYAGKNKDFSVFKLIVTRSQTNTYLVTIKDDRGTTVFSEQLAGENITRTYKFPSGIEGGITGTSIEVRNLKNEEIEVYKISSTSRMVDVVSISKL